MASKSTGKSAGIEQPDPLKSLADAMREAASAASEDATRTSEKLRDAGERNPVSRAAYNGSYLISYGLVYATVFLAKSIPQDNPIVEGFIDGARAAVDAVNEAKGIRPKADAGLSA